MTATNHMFKVIGKDGKEYGPVDAQQLKNWIAQGRLDGSSLVKPEGAADWKPLREFPELQSAVPALPLQAVVARPTSGLAVASLVLGVLGLFTFGLTAVVGLVLGIVALVKINKSQGRLGGFGLAVAGMVVSGVMLVMLPVLAAMLLPALARAKSRTQAIQCMTHVKQLNLALMMYATDHNDTFPPADKWCDLIKPYVGGSTDVFQCPAQPTGRCSYAYNANLANQRTTEISSPATTVLIFSSTEGWNQFGTPAQGVPHIHGRMLGFVDGHAEFRSGRGPPGR